ncbi:MAG: multiheme c-type cytochrome [Gemmatimonadota bacterium]|jgi:hypothetical protein|nr:hypothetical protein [Gemmatimonadota bacterium]MDP6460348.1 multiheme c-type cytochrome [Gemmatimonadota bacterium]MDP6528553.1 multiheme c-type cytochrome [Gemmatimonadota bacterium]MDP6803303.1 multiheme c-type cytochrome [Gemmatimonadota bacterium]MDP7032310.1 multiheme c-type cytochrome [Gemmatimonadota bacterium]
MRAAGENVFLCAAGDFTEYKSARRASMDDTRGKAASICRVLGMLGYDAIGLGEKDLAFGTAFLEKHAAEEGLPLTSANARDATTNEPLFSPFIIAERNGVRVGFLSVTAPERHIVSQVEDVLVAEGITIADPTVSAEEYLPQLRATTDVVVLLAHTGIETATFLAEDLDVDVVVVGHFPAIEEQPRDLDGTLVVMAGGKSDHFGKLEITLDEDRSMKSWHGEAVRLLATGPEDPEIAAIAKAADEKEKAQKRDRQLQSQRKRELELARADKEKIHDRGGIFGAESCKSCHQDIYDSWMETPHAAAFATLAEADAWDRPECVGCHITGPERTRVVEDPNVAPEVWNVQCEACHGSGLEHTRDGSYVTAGEALCVECHDPDNSPDFDYATYASYGVH